MEINKWLAIGIIVFVVLAIAYAWGRGNVLKKRKK